MCILLLCSLPAKQNSLNARILTGISTWSAYKTARIYNCLSYCSGTEILSKPKKVMLTSLSLFFLSCSVSQSFFFLKHKSWPLPPPPIEK